MNLNNHLHLAPRLRMSGVILLLPLYTFMLWTGKILLFFMVWSEVLRAVTYKVMVTSG